MNDSPIAALVRGWVDLYTRGLTPELRTARRDEVSDDLWCQREEAEAGRRSFISLDAEMLVRLVFGIPADLSWRLAHSTTGVSVQERSPSISARILAISALLAALLWTALMVAYGILGESVWDGAWTWLIVILSVGGGLAFTVTAFGLLWRFQEQLSYTGVVGSTLAGLGGIAAAFEGSWAITLLPIGSAAMVWDLSRLGVLSRGLAIVHVVGSIGLLVPIVSALLFSSTAGVAFVALAIPYPVTWFAIGASLWRGIPVAQQAASA